MVVSLLPWVITRLTTHIPSTLPRPVAAQLNAGKQKEVASIDKLPGAERLLDRAKQTSARKDIHAQNFPSAKRPCGTLGRVERSRRERLWTQFAGSIASTAFWLQPAPRDFGAPTPPRILRSTSPALLSRLFAERTAIQLVQRQT